jgi:hypothetical protein
MFISVYGNVPKAFHTKEEMEAYLERRRPLGIVVMLEVRDSEVYQHFTFCPPQKVMDH